MIQTAFFLMKSSFISIKITSIFTKLSAAEKKKAPRHSVYEEEKSERAKALLAPIAFLLARSQAVTLSEHR